MKISSVVSKLTKAGWVTTEVTPGTYNARNEGNTYEIGWHRNGKGSDEAVCLGLKRIGHNSEIESDYCAWSFYNSVASVIKSAECYGQPKQEGRVA